jgi:hypothetical protein
MAASRSPGPAGAFFRSPIRPLLPQLLHRYFRPGPVGVLATSLSNRGGSQRNCTREAQITLSGGRVVHSGFPNHPDFFGLVEARAGVHVQLRDNPKPIPHNMVLSFEAERVSEANWLQFLGPSVLAVTVKEMRGSWEESPLQNPEAAEGSQSRRRYCQEIPRTFLTAKPRVRSPLRSIRPCARGLRAGRRGYPSSINPSATSPGPKRS